MKKRLLFLLILVAILLVPIAYAELDPNNFATIEVLSGGISEVESSDPSNIIISYKEANLKWYKADPNVNRNADGWWIGIRITVPQNSSAFNAAKAQYKRGNTEQNMEKSAPIKFSAVKDSDKYVNAWFRVDEELLKKVKETGGEYIAMIYKFDWNGDDKYEQKAIVKVNPDKIQLGEVDEEYVKVTINSEKANRVFTVKKGQSLNGYLTKEEKDVLNELMTAPKGKKFVGIFNENKKFYLDTIINTDTVLTIKFEEENPKTSDNIMIFITINILAIIGFMGSICYLKRQN